MLGVLTAESVPNAYILEGGVNDPIATFGEGEVAMQPTPAPVLAVTPCNLSSSRRWAIGMRPNPNPHAWDLEYTPKVLDMEDAEELVAGAGFPDAVTSAPIEGGAGAALSYWATSSATP